MYNVIITIIILAAGYLTEESIGGASQFLNMSEDMMLLCFRRVKLLACVKQRSSLGKAQLLKPGYEWPHTLLKPGGKN